MKTQTSTESAIVILNVKIGICEDQLKLLEEDQKKVLSMISDCGTYNHFTELNKRMYSNNALIAIHKRDLKKHRKELQKENEFLLHLQKKNGN